MTEIFYRLLSQANSDFFLLEKDERLECIDNIVNILLANHSRPSMELTILKATRGILDEYVHMNLRNPTRRPPIKDRKALAAKCLTVKLDAYEFVLNNVKEIEYRTISVEDFSSLMRSEYSHYLYIALYVSEIRGRMLEYLLDQRV